MDGVWDDIVATTVVSNVVYHQNLPTIHLIENGFLLAPL